MDRDQLIQLAVEGEIKYKFIQEVYKKTLERLSEEYDMQQLGEANGQLADIIVTKLSEFMESIELMNSKNKLEKDLSGNKLFRRDIKKIDGYITPHHTFCLISGRVTIGGHVGKMSSEPPNKDDE